MWALRNYDEPEADAARRMVDDLVGGSPACKRVKTNGDVPGLSAVHTTKARAIVHYRSGYVLMWRRSKERLNTVSVQLGRGDVDKPTDVVDAGYIDANDIAALAGDFRMYGVAAFVPFPSLSAVFALPPPNSLQT
jgi:hypothetical protein